MLYQNKSLITPTPLLPVKCTCGYPIGSYGGSIYLYAKFKKIPIKDAIKAFNIDSLCCIKTIISTQ